MRGPRASRPLAFENPLRAGRPRTSASKVDGIGGCPQRKPDANVWRLPNLVPRFDAGPVGLHWRNCDPRRLDLRGRRYH